jgi:hypothetical protein
MNEERNKFENLMSDYEELGVWESGLGGKGVGYKDTGEMSEFAKAMMKRGKKTGDGDAFDRWGDRADAFAQDEASYDYEENPYAGKFGLPGDSDMRDFAKPLPEDYQPDTYGAPIETDGDDWERSGQRRRNYIENRGPFGKMAKWKRPPKRDQYSPGADSGDGSYRPKPYNRYGIENSFSADLPGMMSTKEDDFLRYEDWKAFRQKG